MAIGINFSDEVNEREIGPFTHWDEDLYKFYGNPMEYKEAILKAIEALSKKDKKWLENKIKESKCLNI